MILLAHLLLGAAIGTAVKNPILAVILALLSHYLLDLLPHIEYPIENIKQKQWHKARKDFFKVAVDIISGIILILLFSKNYPIIYICAFFAILPDGFSLLSLTFPNKIFSKHDYFHTKKVHHLKDKKISRFWRIYIQVVLVVIFLIALKF